MLMSRRQALIGAATLAALPRVAFAAPAALTVASRQLDVLGRSATVYGITGPDGQPGLTARAGDRFTGLVRNDSGGDLILHWHGQVLAKNTDDRTRPSGGVQPGGTAEAYDFPLATGTHWKHSHTLTEQQLLAAPMVTPEADAGAIPEADAGDIPEAVVMLHDFAVRSPAEISAALTTSPMHDMQMMDNATGQTKTMDMGGMSMSMPGMTHANDVAYDAYLANDRTLADPQVIRVAPGPFRLRIINGGTATASRISTGTLPAPIIAVDGTPVLPVPATLVPMAQGQRLDLLLTIPPQAGAFPILAQVEAKAARTGVILATAGAPIARVPDQAAAAAPDLGSALDAALTARSPLPARPADQMLPVTLGMEPGYRWTINGAAHGEAAPLQAALGSRVELMFMNPTLMMHPMHLHGHHFQIVDLGMGRFNGPRRDTVAVPPGAMVTVAVDFDKPGDWFLHCHHLYHMASGMMTSVRVN